VTTRRPAPAKLNLDLRVGPARADGFHPVCSWMTTIGLFDTVSLRRDSEKQPTAVEFACDAPDVPSDESNLCVKAAHAFAAMRGPIGRIGLTLEKRIPHGGGLGGGSSDAAAVLQLLADGDEHGLHEIAVTLGSDVPFFLGDGSARATGRGEVLTALPRPRPSHAILILPGEPLGTAEVYRAFDALPPRPLNMVDYIDWTDLPAAELLLRLANDLEPAAFARRPALGRLRAEAERFANRPVRLTGSGSTLFTLANDPDDVKTVVDVLSPLEADVLAVELCPRPASG
jgi:4-diphosphocytidyl-2-C-methyl-D-erythritol kinase